ncbi:MAG: MATE family efflux transporter [Clostridia bacterium]|nr:MATE family efflux transporter [Clostridia bacterium]
MQIQLSDKFTYGRLLRFTIPSIVMMVFTSIYGVVDGFFVSNFVGEEAFTAVNFIMPYLMILGAIGFMFGTGGCALIAKTLGEGNQDKANRLFSLFVYLPFGLGIVIAILGFFLVGPVASLLGAEGLLLENSILYGRVFLLGLPFYMLQIEFQSFFVTAEKPKLGLVFTVASGVTNIVLDALFVGLFSWGLVGAAVATVISQVVGGLAPIIYFARKNTSLLRLGRADFDKGAIFHACTNGSSELMTNVSMSLVGMLYNFQLLKYEGEPGVAAYGVLMYVNFIFISMFIGYAVGSAPIISYNYGAGRGTELKNVLKKSLVIIGVMSLLMFGLGEALATPMSMLFVGYNPSLLELTKRGFYICAFSFLFSGFAIFGSSFFTALNNGPVSAIISFLRTAVLQIIAVLVLPLWLGTDGIWLSIVLSEALAVVVTVAFILGKRKKYGY